MVKDGPISVNDGITWAPVEEIDGVVQIDKLPRRVDDLMVDAFGEVNPS